MIVYKLGQEIEEDWKDLKGNIVILSIEKDGEVTLDFLKGEYRLNTDPLLDMFTSTKDIFVTVKGHLIFSKYNTTVAIIDRCNGEGVLIDDYTILEMAEWITENTRGFEDD